MKLSFNEDTWDTSYKLAPAWDSAICCLGLLNVKSNQLKEKEIEKENYKEMLLSFPSVEWLSNSELLYFTPNNETKISFNGTDFQTISIGLPKKRWDD